VYLESTVVSRLSEDFLLLAFFAEKLNKEEKRVLREGRLSIPSVSLVGGTSLEKLLKMLRLMAKQGWGETSSHIQKHCIAFSTLNCRFSSSFYSNGRITCSFSVTVKSRRREIPLLATSPSPSTFEVPSTARFSLQSKFVERASS
jgi:hypothetical protein